MKYCCTTKDINFNNLQRNSQSGSQESRKAPERDLIDRLLVCMLKKLPELLLDQVHLDPLLWVLDFSAQAHLHEGYRHPEH